MTPPTHLPALHLDPALWLWVAFGAAVAVLALVRGARVVSRDGWRRL